jgi:hypothetical protein
MSRMMLILLSISMLTLAFSFQPVRASSPTVHNIGQYKDSATIDEMVLDWYRTYDFSTDDADVAYAVAVDSENNIIVVGLDRTVDLGQWRIMKFDNEGNELSPWPYIYNPTDGWDEPKSVAVDSSNNIIVVGREQPSGSFSRWGMRKLDENANLIWAKSEDFPPVSGDNYKDLPEDVAVDKSDNSIIVVGYDQQEGLSMGNWRVIKYDSTIAGNEIFNRQYPDSGHSIAYGVAVQSDRSIIVVGTDKTGATKNDWRIKKLDPDTGDVIPACDKIILSTPENDIPIDVAVDSNDNIIVVGFEGVAPSDTKWKIIKLDPNCNVIGSWDGDWSPSQDSARSIAVDSYDNILVVGGDENLVDDMKWRIMKFGSGVPLTLLWEDTVNPTIPGAEEWDNERANGVAVLEGVNIVVVGSDDSPTPDHYRQWRIMKFEYTYAREIHDLIETIETWDLSKGTESSLTARLASVIHQLIKRNENIAINKLTVLLNQIEALRDKKLTNDQANYLTAEAQRIIELING